MSFYGGSVFNKETSTSHHLSIDNRVSINETKLRTATFLQKLATIQQLDHLLIQLNVRFDSSSVMVYDGLVIIPANMLNCTFCRVL